VCLYRLKVLKVWTSMIYIPPLSGKQQQRLTNRSGVLTSFSSRQRSAISGPPIPNEWTLVLQSAARQTHLCPSQLHYDLHPTMLSGNDSLFLVAIITRYCMLLIFLPRRGGRVSWPKHHVCKYFAQDYYSSNSTAVLDSWWDSNSRVAFSACNQ